MRTTCLNSLRRLGVLSRNPAFWALGVLLTFGMTGTVIAQAVESTAPTAAGGVSTNAQRQQLNRLQGSVAAEINRRLAMLNEIKDDLQHSRTLDGAVIGAIRT